MELAGVMISEEEAAQYDRQIRLWGLDSQKRLCAASVLIIGLAGVGAEVAKNIILAGVKSVTLMDDAVVTDEDKCFQFLVQRQDIGKNRAQCSRVSAQQLNPRVEVKVVTDGSSTIDSAEFLKQFNVVCATRCSLDEMIRLNDLCHCLEIPFLAGEVYGYFGFTFSDLCFHTYTEEIVTYARKAQAGENPSGEPLPKKTKTDQETKTVKRSVQFKKLRDCMDVNWTTPANTRRLRRNPPVAYFIIRALTEFMRESDGRRPTASEADKQRLSEVMRKVLSDSGIESAASTNNQMLSFIPDSFAEYCISEFNPVSAILGGVICGEIIKAVQLKDEPIMNFFYYNGLEGCGTVELFP